MNKANIRQVAAAVAVGLVAMAVLFFVDLPGHNMLWREIGNAGHLPLFGLLGIVFFQLSLIFLGRVVPGRGGHYFIALMLTGGLGFFTEFVQRFTPRDADFWDIVRDVLGAIFFLGFKFFYESRTHGRLIAVSSAFRRAVLTASLLAFTAGISPVLLWSAAYIYRDQVKPSINRFESPWESLFWRTSDADLEIVATPASWTSNHSRQCGKLTLYPGQYPDLYYHEPPPSWSGYTYFVFDLFSPEDTAISLTLRIDDRRHDGAYTDRFNRTFSVRPGASQIRMSLDDIRNAPAGRPMDMDKISAFFIFSHRLRQPLTVYIDDIRLE